MTTWDFDTTAQATRNQFTHMMYYSSQLIETDRQLSKFEESRSKS
jgi:hypothetical protein